MRSDPTRPRPLASLLLACLIAAAGFSVLAPPAAADHSLELYWSDQFGYLFFYDPAIWVIEEEWSDLESDYVFLSTEDTFVYYLAFEAPGTTPETCIQDILTEFAADPEILRIEPLGEGLTEPAITTNDIASTTNLVLTLEEEGEQYKLVTQETCIQLVPNESLLYSSTNLPVELYNEIAGSGAPFANTPAIALTLPDQGAYPAALGTAAVPVPAAGGAPLGLLSGHLHCAVDAAPQLLVLAEAVATEASFPVDPAAFFLTADGEAMPAAFGDWLYPEMGTETFIELEPGGLSLFWFDLPAADGPYELSYAPAGAESEPIPIGTIDPSACTAPAPGPVLPATVDLD